MPDGSKYKMCLPQCFTDADCMIDYSVVRPQVQFTIRKMMGRRWKA